MSQLISGLYGTLATVLGAALPLSEHVVLSRTTELLPTYHLYLYAGTVLFLTYVHAAFACRRDKPAEDVAAGTASNASAYVRAAAVALGVAAMLHSGLELGKRLEEDLQVTVSLVAPAARVAFIFLQMHWVLANSRLSYVYAKHRLVWVIDARYRAVRRELLSFYFCLFYDVRNLSDSIFYHVTPLPRLYSKLLTPSQLKARRSLLVLNPCITSLIHKWIHSEMGQCTINGLNYTWMCPSA